MSKMPPSSSDYSTTFNVNTKSGGDKKNYLVVRGTVSRNPAKEVAAVLFQNYDADDVLMHDMAEVAAVDHFGDPTHNGFGDLVLKTNPGSTASYPMVERMRLTWDGMVGIGTSSPSNALDVVGSIRASTSIASGIWNPSSVLVADGNSIAVSSAVSINELNHLVGSKASIQTQLDTLSNNVRIVASAAAGGSNASVLPQQYGPSRAMVTDNAGYPSVSTVTAMEIGCLAGVTSSIQTQIAAMQPVVTGAAASVCQSLLTPSVTVTTDAFGQINGSFVTAAELACLSGVASSVQTQLDSKQAVATGAAVPFLASLAQASSAIVSDAAGMLSASVATASEIAFLSGVTSPVQAQLDGKQPLVTGAAATVTEYKLFPHAVLVSDANGDIAHSPTTATELSYVHGVTSAIQTQLDGKQPLATGAAVPFLTSAAPASAAIVSDASGMLSASVATASEIAFLSGVTSSVQTQLDGKQPLVTGAAATVTATKLFPNAVLVSDATGNIAQSTTTATELSYVRGVTSAVQTQLNGKQPLATGSATTFLNSNAGANLAVTTNAAGKLSTIATTATELGFVSGVTAPIQAQLNALNVWASSNATAYYTAGPVCVGTRSAFTALTVAGQATAYSYYGQTGGSAIAPAYSFLGYSNTGVFAPTTASLAFSANGLERARFTSNGFFGVGVTAPTAPLHVGLGPSTSTSTSAYFNGGTGSALLTSQNYSSTISIASDSSVWVKNGWSFIASSDRRIKKDIALADLSNVSGIFDSIDLHTYGYIDDAYARSNQPSVVHGFIAQQVVGVLPEAVTITTETIPNVFSMATLSIDSTSTTLPIDSSSTSTSTTTTLSFDSPFSLSAGVVAGDRLTCYVESSNDPTVVTVLSTSLDATGSNVAAVTVEDSSGRLLSSYSSSSSRSNNNNNNNANVKAFVYGKVVDDFLTLDKNKLMSICFGKVKTLDAEVASLRSQVANLHAIVMSR